MTIKALFQKIELAVEKRFPVKGVKALVRLFNGDGKIEREGGDLDANPDEGDVIMNIRPISPEEDAAIREKLKRG